MKLRKQKHLFYIDCNKLISLRNEIITKVHPKLSSMYDCCERSLFICSTQKIWTHKKILRFKKRPCSVKVSALHRMYRRMNSFLCSQPYCKTKFTEKKKRSSLRLFQKLSLQQGESQKVTQVSISVGQDSIESQNKWAKSQGEIRLQIQHLEERCIKNLQENHTQPWQ